MLLRRSGRAVYLYSTAHKTQLTILQLEDFLPASLFPDLLPQPIGRFINNIFRELNITTKLIINTMSPQDPPQRCHPKAAVVDETADPGGRPRLSGAAGCTGSAHVCGVRRSTDTASSLSPTCSRKTFSPRSRTA